MREWTEEESKKLAEYMMSSDRSDLHEKLSITRFKLISDGFPPRRLHELQHKLAEIYKNKNIN